MGYEKPDQTILKRVNEKSIRVSCRCGTEYTHTIADFTPEFMEEFNQFENLTAGPCPTCNELTIFNMNLPETEAQDIEEAPFLPELEEKQREHIRELMWKVRPDLDETEREAVEQQRKAEIEEIYNADLETVKEMYRRELDLIRE